MGLGEKIRFFTTESTEYTEKDIERKDKKRNTQIQIKGGMGGKVVKFGTMIIAHCERFPVNLQIPQFRLQYIEANSPVNLRILLQFLQLQKYSSEFSVPSSK